MEVWAALMLVAGGLFAGGAATFSWSRVPLWRTMPIRQFGEDFGATIHRTDKVQPALLVLAIASSIGFAVSADGSPRLLASLGAAGLLITLVASVTILVPLQRRIVSAATAETRTVEEMRRRWFRGHHGRSVLATAAFVLLAVAAAA